MGHVRIPALEHRKPSILFLADHLAYSGEVSHGVTSYYLNVLTELASAGVHVAACFLRDSPHGVRALQAQGIEVVAFGSSRWSLVVFVRVLKLLLSRDFDIIHASQIKGSLVARIIGSMCDVPVVVHVHDETIPAWYIRWANALFASRRDVGVCVSAATSDCAARGYKIDKRQQVVLPTGVVLGRIQRHLGRRKELRASLLGVFDDRPVVGVVARFFTVKGHRAFIAGLPDLVHQFPEARFVFVGDGPDRAACEEIAQDLGVSDSTLFLGQRNDVAELMNCLDVLALPSLSEGLPLVAIEGLAAGVPLVGFDVGGMREVLDDGVTGFLVPAGNMPALTASLARLLADAALRRTMSRAAAADAQRFCVSRHVKVLVDIYSRLRLRRTKAATATGY